MVKLVLLVVALRDPVAAAAVVLVMVGLKLRQLAQSARAARAALMR